MNKKLRTILTTVSIILIISSLICVLFPTVSITVTKFKIDERIDRFNNQIENIVDLGNTTYEEALEQGKIDDQGYLLNDNHERISAYPIILKADIDRLQKDSEKYNRDLAKHQRSLLTENTDYTGAALNLENYGIVDGLYGYVSAPSIDMKLPIYLGANDYNMSIGAAHMCYTSLPIGGANTNCVLSGHTGYIGKTFFDNLPNLSHGDTVSLTNYWNTVNYRVVKTFTCKPNQVDEVFIENGKDRLSLFTCFYDGNGFIRYYVVCERA